MIDPDRTLASSGESDGQHPGLPRLPRLPGLPGLQGLQETRASIQDPLQTQARLGPAQASPETAQRRQIGRYLVLSSLGVGGMGVVYRAYDPDLDRRVAIKILRGPSTGDAKTRLVREAQAMAKLSHPSVVQVFDVGDIDDGIFVAMDLVEGEDLKAWIDAGSHRWEEVLGVLVQAGEGLAAAHRVGLIHRDFKPANVLLSRDPRTGQLRAQVADFGLARLGDGTPEEFSSESPARDLRTRGGVGSSALQIEITGAGSLLGTPAYMSPEQHDGLVVDARTDQFSFAVALYEALYQRRPFDGETIEALAHESKQPRRPPPPPGSRVPAWLHRLVVRAMHPDRAERFPGMEELLSAIEAGRSKGRRRWAVASAIIAVVGVGVGVGLRGSAPELCVGGPGRIAEAWGDAQRTAGEAAFAGTERPYAADTWSRAAARIDTYSDLWLDAYTETCAATLIRGEVSAAVMDLRMVCLDRHLRDLRLLTQGFAEADATTVEHAVRAVAALPEVAECGNVEQLLREVAEPSPAVAVEVADLRQELGAARSMVRLHQSAQATALLTGLRARVDAVDFPPLRAEFLAGLGIAQLRAGADEESRKTGQEALWAAIESHHDELIDAVLRGLVEAVGYRLGHRDEAQIWIDHAMARVARGGDQPEALAALLQVVAMTEITAGQNHTAQAQLVRSIDLLEGQGEEIALIDPLIALASAYVRSGAYGEAQRPLERALAIIDEELGPTHPQLINALNTLALIHERGARYDQALAALGRTLDLLIAHSGADHPNVGIVRQNVGGMLIRTGDHERARQELTLAREILEASVGPDHIALGGVNTFVGDLELSLGDTAAAAAAYQRSVAVRSAALGDQHFSLGLPLVGLARVALETGDMSEARSQSARALALYEQGDADPGDLGFARLTHAQAIWEEAPEEAIREAEQALRELEGVGPAVAKERREADAWIQEHRR